MSRAVLTLYGPTERARAVAWLNKAPPGTVVEFKQSKRSTPQNARMWAMLTDVACAVQWHGVRLSPDDWKLIFMDALNRELRMVPNLDGNGFVNLGRSSSSLTKAEMSDLIEIIHAFGARHDVKFGDLETLTTGAAA